MIFANLQLESGFQLACDASVQEGARDAEYSDIGSSDSD